MLFLVAVFITLAIASVFFVYKYTTETAMKAENINDEAKIKAPLDGILDKTEESKLEGMPGVQTEGTDSERLIICADKCGDGVCQKTDPTCEKGNLNCVCAETKQDCPQDCK